MIRAWTNKETNIDIRGMAPRSTFRAIHEAAEKCVYLPKQLVRLKPTLNEVYHSFMDPAGEIVNIRLLQCMSDCYVVMCQLYFVVEEDRRRLIFDQERGIEPFSWTIKVKSIPNNRPRTGVWNSSTEKFMRDHDVFRAPTDWKKVLRGFVDRSKLVKSDAHIDEAEMIAKRDMDRYRYRLKDQYKDRIEKIFEEARVFAREIQRPFMTKARENIIRALDDEEVEKRGFPYLDADGSVKFARPK